MLLAGCAKKADESHAPGAGATGDDLVALEQQLAQREGELRAVGVAPYAPGSGDVAGDTTTREPAPPSEPEAQPPTTPQPATPQPMTMSEKAARSDDDPGRCQRVCEIAAAICALEDQICGLVPRHRDDSRYQAACDRAAADCQLANEACHACNPT